MRVPLPVVSTTAGAERNEVQRLLNCYVEAASPRSEQPLSVIGTPGAFAHSNTGQASMRGMRYWGDTLYSVSGGAIYRHNADKSVTLLGPVPATGRVMMAEMPSYLCIMAGSEVWTIDRSDQLAVVPIPAFAGVPSTLPGSICVLNATLIISLEGSDFYCWSQPNDPLTIDGQDIARAERNGDSTVTVAADHGELLLIGRRSIEVLYDTGVASGRFQSVGSGVVERGIGAAETVAQDDNSLFWLGDDRIVYRLNGRTPQRISTHAMETAIQDMPAVSDAWALTYTWKGHKFYAITFPGAKQTWEINLNTGSSHERDTFGQDYWMGRCAATGYDNETLIGSAFEGTVYALSSTYFFEGDRTIERMVRTPYQQFDRQRFVTVRLEVDMDTGTAPIRGDGNNPVLLLRHTENGRQWSAERRAEIGMTGEYQQRVTFHRLGQARRRAYELRTTDPMAFRMTAIHAHVDVGEL